MKKLKYLLLLLLLFSSKCMAFIPIPIPLPLGLAKFAKIEDAIKQVLGVLFASQLLSIIVLLSLMVWAFIRFSAYVRKKKFEKLVTLLHRLYMEAILLKSVSKFNAAEKLEIELSREESIGLIKKFFHKKLVRLKIGRHAYKRIVDGLKLIKENKVDLEKQMHLIENWIDLVDVFLR